MTKNYLNFNASLTLIRSKSFFPNHNFFCCTLDAIGKALIGRVAPSLFHDISTYGGENIEC
jgi:hypothetical protein